MDETSASQPDTWLLPPEPSTDEVASTGRSLSGRLKALGIVATAVVVGFVGVLTVQGSSASPSASNPPTGRGGFGAPPGMTGGFAPRGVQGTVASVSSSSITVRTASGTSTVKVTSATEVIVNGAPGSLSDVTKGATVFVHTEGTGSSQVAERIFVGTMGGFGPPPGRQPGGTGTGTTSST